MKPCLVDKASSRVSTFQFRAAKIFPGLYLPYRIKRNHVKKSRHHSV